jgi:hypothetical protein
MLPHEQLVLGIAAGLFLYTLLYWSPSRGDVLAAVVAAGLTDLVVVNHVRREVDARGAVVTQPGELLSSPHFHTGIALALATASAALHAFRQDN